MGNAALLRCVAAILRERVRDVVKDVDEKLLDLSLRQRSISLKRLSLQERFLENIGLVLPYAVAEAWLEDVTLTLERGHVICAKASRLVVHGEVRHRDTWLREVDAELDWAEQHKEEYLREHEVAALGGNVAGQGSEGGIGGSMLTPELELDIAGLEIIVNDSASQPHAPFALALVASRLSLGERIRLGGRDVAWTLDMRLEHARLLCTDPKDLGEAAVALPGPALDPDDRRETGCQQAAGGGPGEDEDRAAEVVQEAAGEGPEVGARRADSGRGKGGWIDAEAGDLESETVIGPCPWMQIAMTFCSSAGALPSSHPEFCTRRTVAPPGLGRGDNQEPLPKKLLLVRTANGAISLSQTQLATVVAHGRMWALWFSLYRDIAPAPPEDAALLYQKRWLERICEASMTGSLDFAKDHHIALFEQQNTLEQALYQRRLALLSTSAAGEHPSAVGPPAGVCGWTTSPRSAVGRGRDPTHRTCFMVDVDVSDTVVELRADGSPLSPGAGAADSPKPGAAGPDGGTALRFAALGQPLAAFAVRVLVHVDDHPDIMPTSLQVIVEDSRLELERPGEPPAALLETRGQLYTCADLQGHCDGLLCPQQPPRRGHLGADGQLRGCFEPSVLLEAMSVIVGAVDVVATAEPCVNLSQGNAELRGRLDRAAATLTRPPAPKPRWPPWDLRGTTSQPIVLAFPALIGSTLMLQLQPVMGPPAQWAALCPKGTPLVSGGAEAKPAELQFSADSEEVPEEAVLRLAILGASAWAESAGTAAEGRAPGAELVRCQELVCEVGALAVLARLAPIHARLAPEEVALLAAVLRSAANAGAGVGEPAPKSSIQEEEEAEEEAKERSCDSTHTPPHGEREAVGGAFSLNVSLRSASLALHGGPSCKTPALLASAGGQELQVGLQGNGSDVQVHALEYRLHRFAISDGAGRLHLLHCSPPPQQQRDGFDNCLAPVAVALHLSRGLPESDLASAHCEVAPVWLCAHWQVLLEALRCARALEAAARAPMVCASHRSSHLSLRSSVSSVNSHRGGTSGSTEQESEHSEDPALSAPGNAAEVLLCSARLNLSKVLLYVPCAGGDGLLLHMGLYAACDPCLQGMPGLRATATVSRLSVAAAPMPLPAAPAAFRPPQEPQEPLILQPVRLRLQATYRWQEGPTLVSVQLEVSPVCLTLQTGHLTLALSLQERLAALLEGLGPGDSHHGASGEPHEAGAKPQADAVPGVSEAAQPAQASWSLQLRVQAPAVRLEVFVPPGATELGVVVLEDCALYVVLASSASEEHLGASEMDARTGERSDGGQQPCFARLRVLSCAGTLWSDLVAPTTGQVLPLLEPTHLKLHSRGAGNALVGGLGSPAPAAPADRLLLDMTWVNVQISADTAAAAVKLSRSLTEACEAVPTTSGLQPAATAEEEHAAGGSDVVGVEPEPSRSPLLLQETPAFGSSLARMQRPRPPSIMQAEEPLPLPAAMDERSERRHSLVACPSPSARRGPLRLRNCLGVAIRVGRMVPGVEPQELAPGEALELPNLFGNYARQRPQERQGWESRLFVRLPGCQSVDLPLLPTPQVLHVPSAPRSVNRTTTQSTSSATPAASTQLTEWVNGKVANATHRAQSQLTTTIRRTMTTKRSANRLVLARRDEKEVQLSSLVFLENRSAIALAVFPSDQGEMLELPPGSAPRPVPLAWCSSTGKKRRSGLWCCPASKVTDDLLTPLEEQQGDDTPSMATLARTSVTSNVNSRSLAESGLLQLLVGRQEWQQIQQYRSMVADRYFLPAHRLQGDLGGLCATPCAVSARLRAEHQALFFVIVLEPAVQICNRLCCNVRLLMPDQTSVLLPGQDTVVLDPSSSADLELDAPSGPLRLQQPVPLENRQGRVRNSSLLVFCDAAGAELEAFLSEEPGLLPSESWGRLQVRQYSPLARRFTLFTSHWLLNRCGDCQLFVPGAYESSSGILKDSQVPLRHVPWHALRMLSQHVVRRNSIQVGLCAGSTAGASPLSPSVVVGRPADGEAVVPAGPHGPQRCLGYTVRTAPWPFYRTLLVEFTRRFTLVNHTRRRLWCSERGQPSSSVLELQAGGVHAFDPQGPEPQLRISGVGPQEGYSAFFSLEMDEGGQRRHFQLLHKVDMDAEGGRDGRCALIPVPLGGSEQEEQSAQGKVWCVAAVDMLLNSGAVVVRFADPRGPAFRIVNRTGRDLQIQQDCLGAPSFDVPTEHSLPFAWFSPSLCHWLLVRLPADGEQQRYEIGQVKVHEPPLRVGGKTRSTRWRETFRKSGAHPAAGHYELFRVRTRVRLGCREVHAHPWVKLENWTEVDMAVREANEAREVVVRSLGGRVCLHPGLGAAYLSFQIRDYQAPKSGGWSQPIRLGRKLIGTKNYLRHPRSQLETGPEQDSCHTTEVEVQKDVTSDFLVVQLRPCSHQPYLLENLSSYNCTVAPIGAAGWAIALPRKGGQVPFPSHLWADASAQLGAAGALHGAPASGRPRAAHATISAATGDGLAHVDVNLERPQVVIARPLRIWVKRERPRVIVVQDAPLGAHGRTSFRMPRLLTMARRVVDVGAELVNSAPASSRLTLTSPALSSPSTPMTFQRSERSRHTIRRIETTSSRLYASSPLRSRSFLLPVGDPLPSSGKRKSRQISVRRLLMDGLFVDVEDRPASAAAQTPPGVALPSPRERRPAVNRLELRLEGLGATMVDEVALSEVAFFCAEGLEVHASWQEALEVAELWAQVQAVQLDVRDGEGHSDAVLKPARGRALGLRRPLAKLHMLVVAKDGGRDWEMRHFSLGVQPLEICLDTRDVYELAEWALDLSGQAATSGLAGATPSAGFSGREGLLAGRAEDSLRRTEGDRLDRFCGEPLHVLQPEAEEFEASAPVFVRNLLLRRIRCMLSVHFSGRRLGDFRNSERLQALDHVLRHCLPLDFTDATVLLGRRAASWRGRIRDVRLKDEFLPDGFAGLAEGLLADCAGTFLRQVPNILFSQRLLGSPAKLGQELFAGVGLAVYGAASLQPRAFAAAVMLCFVAVLASLEGIFATLAKAACSASTGSVPAALCREPASSREAVQQILSYGIPWHVSRLLLKWRRLARAMRISRSWLTRLWCILIAALGGIAAAVSVGLVPAVKLLQALRILVQHFAWRVYPECESGWAQSQPRRACPQQFRAGAALQFSCAAESELQVSCSAALNAVCQATPGLWSQDWRLRLLPDGEGVLVAVQDGGLFLVRNISGHPKILRRMQVAGTYPEVLAQPSASGRRGPAFLLRFRGAGSGDQDLGLRSWEAAMTAFSFIAECTAEDADHFMGDAPSAPDRASQASQGSPHYISQADSDHGRSTRAASRANVPSLPDATQAEGGPSRWPTIQTSDGILLSEDQDDVEDDVCRKAIQSL